VVNVAGSSVARDTSLHCAVLDALPVEVLVHDRTTILFANIAAQAAFGATSAEELEGLPITRVVHPDGIAAGNQRRELLFERGQCFTTIKVKLRTLRGDTFYVDGMACRITIGDDDYALILQASFGGTGLPASGGFISSASSFPEGTPLALATLESLPLPVVAHDATHIVYINEATQRAFRAESRDELVGRAMCDVLHPDGREAGMERRRLLFEKGYAFSQISAKTIACDGTTLYTIASGGAVTAEDGNRMGFCSIHSVDAEPGRPTFLR
jgi:PAS domain S-box-containing protein